MTSSKQLEIHDDVLDKLEELSIINIDEHDDSPSYGTASLPTPDGPRVDLNLRAASPYHHHQHHHLSYWFEDVNSAHVMDALKPPGAPLLKDMDSFSEGTGSGSFEDLPAAATNEFGEPIRPATAATVSLLPPPDHLWAYIENWRAEVYEGVSLPAKRRRSPSPDDEDRMRRIRPRTRALSLPSILRSPTPTLGYYAHSEPEAPD